MVRCGPPPGSFFLEPALLALLGDWPVHGFTERFVIPSIGLGITGNPGIEEMGLGA